MEHETKSLGTTSQRCLTWIYLLVMLGGFPFYFQNNYINIVTTKKNYFQTATLVFLALIAIFGICAYIEASKPRPLAFPLSAADLCALAFLAVVAVSCYLSPEGAEAFWGNKGRQMGGLFLLLCLGVYFAVSRHYAHRKWIGWLLLFSSILLWFIMACNFWNWDLLGMHSNLSKRQVTLFLGTLGNQNINASYSSVLASLMLAFYYSSEKAAHSLCLWGVSAFGVYACFCTSSDSWLLALSGTLLLLLGLSMGNAPQMMKWLKCCMAFCCGSLAMGLTVAFAKSTHWKNRYIQRFCKQKLLASMADIRVALAGIAILLILGLLVRHMHTGSRAMEFLKKYGNKILIGLLLLGILAAGAAIFPLEDSFGTNRGYIWKRTLLNFKELPLWQKLFGYGPNCFYQSLQQRFGAEMHELFDSPFLDAHNEALQILAITGILGLASYLGMQLSLLASCLRKCRLDGIFLAGSVGITAYLLQGLVNNPSIFTLPPFFLFLGILENRLRKA